MWCSEKGRGSGSEEERGSGNVEGGGRLEGFEERSTISFFAHRFEAPTLLEKGGAA